MNLVARHSCIRTFLLFLLSHHDPLHLDRCISVRICGKQVWLCARCLGLVWGYICTWLLILSLNFANISLSLSPSVLFIIIGIFVALAVFDWSIQTILFIESSNPRRFISGFFLGVGFTGSFFSRSGHRESPYQCTLYYKS